MMRFDERNPAHYRLFNVHSLLALCRRPAPRLSGSRSPSSADFQVLDAPGSGYFDVADVAAATPVTRETFYDLVDPWLHGDGFAKAQYLRLDFPGRPAGELPRTAAGSPGAVLAEHQTGQVYEADLDASRPAFALFRMTWHPNWRVLVDGQSVPTSMLTPGFLGAPIPAGRHHILCRYEPGNAKILMALSGLAICLFLATLEWRLARPSPEKP